MYKKNKKKILCLFIIFFMIFGICLKNISNATSTDETSENSSFSDERFHTVTAITVPEKDINLKLENITSGCEFYLLFPTELLAYNMEKFISNNLENEFDIQVEKAEKIQEYYNNQDYLGYLEYFIEEGYDSERNEIELRHYCLSIHEDTVIEGYTEYNDSQYVKFKINLDGNNEFKFIMKDYLVNYDTSNIVFLIDEYGIETYISVNDYGFSQSPIDSNIQECNIDYTYYTNEDYEAISRNVLLAYLVIFILLFILILLLVKHEIKKYKAHKKEIEERLFWKKKPTKEEKKLEKKKQKEEKKNKHKKNN